MQDIAVKFKFNRKGHNQKDHYCYINPTDRTLEFIMQELTVQFDKDPTRDIYYHNGEQYVYVRDDQALEKARVYAKENNLKELEYRIDDNVLRKKNQNGLALQNMDQKQLTEIILKTQQRKNQNKKQSKEENSQKINVNEELINQIKKYEKSDAYGHLDNPTSSIIMGNLSTLNKQNAIQNEQCQEYKKAIQSLDKWKEQKIQKEDPSYQKQTTIPELNFQKFDIEQKEVNQCKKGQIPKKIVYNQIQIMGELKQEIEDAYNGKLDQKKIQRIVQNRFSDNEKRKFAWQTFSAWWKYFVKGNIDRPPSHKKEIPGYIQRREAPGMLQPFGDKEMIGIVGDWGTGQQDAIDIVTKLVKKGVTIILHLGDVYYAGWPKQFQRVTNIIHNLREISGKDIRYYAIPGNHDYYTFGQPFFDHLDQNNLQNNFKQYYAFFCLRNKSNTVQFIGLNTGLNEHDLTTPFNKWFKGTWLEQQEKKWAIKRINEFHQQYGGKTILLTHHPMFSTFEKILGSWTKKGWNNSNVDTKLTPQLFEVLPKITCWFWGHEHRCSTFKKNSFGVNRCILLGNSAYRNKEEKYYEIRPQYLCGEITEYDYHPKKCTQGYYHHTAIALSGFDKKGCIAAQYIYMNASEKPQKDEIREKIDELHAPIHKEINPEAAYHILEESGLSLGRLKNDIILTTEPIGLQLIKIGQQDGFFIKVFNHKDQFLYYDEKIRIGSHKNLKLNEKDAFVWILTKQHPVRTGDIFNLQNKKSDKLIGKDIQFISKHFHLEQSQMQKSSRFYFYEPPTWNYPHMHPK